MQVIYIDTLLTVNLFIDYILLCIVKKTLHINARHRRLLLGACLGSMLTLSVFIQGSSVLFSAFVKLNTAAAVIFTAFPK